MPEKLVYSDTELVSLEQRMESDPAGYQYIADLAYAYLERQRWEDAIVAYEDAIALKPDDAELYDDLGIAYEEVGKLRKAEEKYRKALSLNSELTSAHLDLGIMYKDQGRIPQAKLHLQLCLAHSNESSEIRKARLHLYPLLATDEGLAQQRDSMMADSGPDGSTDSGWLEAARFESSAEAELMTGLLDAYNIPSKVVRSGSWEAMGLSLGSKSTAVILVPLLLLKQAQDLLSAPVDLETDDVLDEVEVSTADKIYQEMIARVRKGSVNMLLLGFLHLASPGLYSPFGVLLITVGLASLYFRTASMLAIYSLLLLWAGVGNLLVGERLSIIAAAIQLPLVAWALRSFWRYRQIEDEASGQLADRVKFYRQARRLFPWAGILLSLVAISMDVVFFVINLATGVLSDQNEFLMFAFSLIPEIGFLAVAVSVASLLSGYRFKIISIAGAVLGALILAYPFILLLLWNLLGNLASP